ncbi:uncharacterized protein DSM5745_04292 [Aspergillus mulundensis]|uniref:Uncharacterized protein n=1 Tax=Aspergillus mulundensis TaxID=1810919 RepID=A0A3D8SCB3_9EURO|nr:Uncharacterized protein DSM5745_04292 [Aspergillus mulundensis]RDW83966.1 Uncharacterized protein DSM5745_04292 [Aspergillus mulundensis]
MGTTSVRRNLFQNHLSRHPVSTTGPNNGASVLSSQVLQSNATESNSSISAGTMDDGEIVVKDKNGSFTLDIPVLPPIEGEDEDEMEGVEGGAGGSSTAATGADPTGQSEISGREKEKLEAGLVEIMYRNRNRQMSSEPHGELVLYYFVSDDPCRWLMLAEILNLIYQSLRNKVAALDEDNWMYEPEVDTRV